MCGVCGGVRFVLSARCRQIREGVVMKEKCEECGRVFDLFNTEQMLEWAYGHDCEAN